MTGRRLPDHIIAGLTKLALEGHGIGALKLVPILGPDRNFMTPLEVFAEVATGEYWKARALVMLEANHAHRG